MRACVFWYVALWRLVDFTNRIGQVDTSHARQDSIVVRSEPSQSRRIIARQSRQSAARNSSQLPRSRKVDQRGGNSSTTDGTSLFDPIRTSASTRPQFCSLHALFPLCLLAVLLCNVYVLLPTQTSPSSETASESKRGQKIRFDCLGCLLSPAKKRSATTSCYCFATDLTAIWDSNRSCHPPPIAVLPFRSSSILPFSRIVSYPMRSLKKSPRQRPAPQRHSSSRKAPSNHFADPVLP